MSSPKKKKTQSELDILKESGYLDSSQHKHWTFASVEVVKQKRLRGLQRQISFLQNHCTKPLSIPSDEEYFASLRYYCKEIIEICRKFRFPPYVACTAVTYFKRLFLNERYDLINTDGMVMKDTAIFLASKAEQSLFTSVNQLTDFTKIPPHQVVGNELTLLDGISFHLKVWTPFRSFRSFVNDFKLLFKKQQPKGLSAKVEEEIVQKGHALLQDAHISDVPLVRTPSQIALSCLLLVVGNMTLAFGGRQYFEKRFGKHKEVDRLRETVKDTQSLILEGINRCSAHNGEYGKLQKQGNTKIYKLQNLYFSIKNATNTVTKGQQQENDRETKNEVIAQKIEPEERQKKKSAKFKIKIGKKRKNSSTTKPPPKRQRK